MSRLISALRWLPNDLRVAWSRIRPILRDLVTVVRDDIPFGALDAMRDRCGCYVKCSGSVSMSGTCSHGHKWDDLRRVPLSEVDWDAIYDDATDDGGAA